MSCVSSVALSSITKKGNDAASGYAGRIPLKKFEATRRPVVQPNDIGRVRMEKWPAIHFT